MFPIGNTVTVITSIILIIARYPLLMVILPGSPILR